MKRLTYGTRFFADATLVDLPSYLATGLEEHNLVSHGLLDWRLGHDIVLTGGAVLTLSVVPVMVAAGFIAAVPYNYWRLTALGKACH